ncbi:MAG: hypothetical protein HRT88_17640, partial [Lentisphaeraceae bacterium]|nr:hypothetical protein [Lentisphaeraceae bacterium]
MIRIKFPEQLPSKIEAWKVKAQSITDEIIAETRLKKRHELIDQYKNHWRVTDLINWVSDL